MKIKHFCIASAIVLLAAVVAAPIAAFAQAGTTFFVFNVNASAFPDVSFDVRAVDLNNQPVTGLTNATLSVFENGQPVTNAVVTPRVDGPVNIIFVIDQGRLANYVNVFGLNNIRLAMTTLVTGGFFQDELDTVMVLGRQNINSDQTAPALLPPTQSGADFTTFVANFNFARSNGNTKGLLGVEDAVAQMSQIAATGTETTAIVFLTRFIEDPANNVAITAAQNTAALAKSKNISVYVLQTDSFNNQPLQALAAGATGIYVPLKRNTIVTDVSNVYAALNAQRTFYTVTYRSKIADSGPRQITINAAQPTGTGSVGAYDVTISPPTVQVSQPLENSTIVRNAQPNADFTNIVFDKTSELVVADVIFADTPRLLTSVELFANGVSQDVITPTPDQTHFEFTWDIGDIIAEGPNPVTLEVVVTDELGLQVSEQTNITVQVVLPPPTPTPEPPLFPVITIPGFTDVPGGAGLGVVLGVVCLGLLCVAPFPFLVFYFTRPTQAKQMVADIRHTLIGGAPIKSKSLSTLHVIEGPTGMRGETINITKAITTIGRNPKQADIVFYADSESSVSRVHCTIQLDGRTFKLTDNNSTSGTKVNGRRIAPNDPTDLQDGDEIVLGDMGKLGVKMRFGMLMDKTQLPSSGTASDKTFIMDDFDKDDWDKFKG
jgi:hypothetical protein